MHNKTLYFILTLFLISCSHKEDIFSDKDINFKNLTLGYNISYTNKYDISDIRVRLIPLNNPIKLSDKEKEYIIEKTGYGKDLFSVESMFFNEDMNTSCLVAYMPAEKNYLDDLIDYIDKMENNNNILKDYFYINGNKNIQYKIQLENTIIFFTIFEARNSNYLVLSYSFPIYNEYASMNDIANSINSVEFY